MVSNLTRLSALPPPNNSWHISDVTLNSINLMCGEEERIVAEYGEKIIPVIA